MFEIDRVRDGEIEIGYSLYKGIETLVRDRERFEIEGVRDRESQLYYVICKILVSRGKRVSKRKDVKKSTIIHN